MFAVSNNQCILKNMRKIDTALKKFLPLTYHLFNIYVERMLISFDFHFNPKSQRLCLCMDRKFIMKLYPWNLTLNPFFNLSIIVLGRMYINGLRFSNQAYQTPITYFEKNLLRNFNLHTHTVKYACYAVCEYGNC